MIALLNYLGRGFLFLLLEWLVISRLEPGPGWAPVLYPMFFFAFPVQFSASARIVFGFTFGLILDLGLGTGGLHAAATTAMAFVQPFVLRYFLSVDERENNLKPGPKSLGWLRFLWIQPFFVGRSWNVAAALAGKYLYVFGFDCAYSGAFL